MKSESAWCILCKAVISGLLIGIGGIVNLSCENPYMGGFLFSFGLFCIIRYGFALYTGKVGYIPEQPPVYLREVGLTLLGNILGTGADALLIRLTRVGEGIQEKAAACMTVKAGDSLPSSLILGFFCGMLMYLAVDNGKRSTAQGFDTAMVFGTTVPVMVFIFCKFNHSIADCFYFFAGIASTSEIPGGVLYLLTVVVGNALGGMCIPFLKRCFLPAEQS